MLFGFDVFRTGFTLGPPVFLVTISVAITITVDVIFRNHPLQAPIAQLVVLRLVFRHRNASVTSEILKQNDVQLMAFNKYSLIAFILGMEGIKRLIARALESVRKGEKLVGQCERRGRLWIWER